MDRPAVGVLIRVPSPALGEVGGGELPLLPRIVEPSQKPLPLFVARDVQEELEDDRAVRVEMTLEGVEVFVAPRPERLVARPVGKLRHREQFGPDPHDQHVLVVGSVEDRDATAFGRALHASPEERVVEFLGARLLERDDVAALRIDAGEQVLDQAVLAGGVHALQHDEDRAGVVGPEQLLGFRERLDVAGEERLRPFLEFILTQFAELAFAGPARIVVLEPKAAARFDREATQQILVIHARTVAETSRRRRPPLLAGEQPVIGHAASNAATPRGPACRQRLDLTETGEPRHVAPDELSSRPTPRAAPPGRRRRRCRRR